MTGGFGTTPSDAPRSTASHRRPPPATMGQTRIAPRTPCRRSRARKTRPGRAGSKMPSTTTANARVRWPPGSRGTHRPTTRTRNPTASASRAKPANADARSASPRWRPKPPIASAPWSSSCARSSATPRCCSPSTGKFEIYDSRDSTNDLKTTEASRSCSGSSSTIRNTGTRPRRTARCCTTETRRQRLNSRPTRETQTPSENKTIEKNNRPPLLLRTSPATSWRRWTRTGTWRWTRRVSTMTSTRRPGARFCERRSYARRNAATKFAAIALTIPGTKALGTIRLATVQMQTRSTA